MSLFSRRSWFRRGRAARPGSPRPQLECLEDRTLLAASFGSPLTVSPGGAPVALALTDFNGDAKPDLAVVSGSSSDSRVSILQGNGDGTFSSPANIVYAKGIIPNSIAAGDFNGDGRADLVTANSGGAFGAQGDSISVLLNNGNGTFRLPVNLPAGNSPQSVTVGDLNGDGKLDVAVANANLLSPGAGTVTILLGNGNGTFTARPAFPPAAFPLPWPSATSIGTASPISLSPTAPAIPTASTRSAFSWATATAASAHRSAMRLAPARLGSSSPTSMATVSLMWRP